MDLCTCIHVLVPGTLCTQARKGTWLMEALAAAGEGKLMSSAAQVAEAKGKTGCRAAFPVQRLSALGPNTRDVSFTPCLAGLTEARHRSPGGRHIWWFFGHCVLGCRLGGLMGRP